MRQPGCPCHWQTAAKRAHWDMGTPAKHGAKGGGEREDVGVKFSGSDCLLVYVQATSNTLWPWKVRYDVLINPCERCTVTIVIYLSWQLTLVKSGGGFFPLHRFDSAHTAFLIIVRRFCLANNLQGFYTKYVFTKDTEWCIFMDFLSIPKCKNKRQNKTMCHWVATYCTREGRMLQSMTKSLHSVLSPAMFPKAHTACRQSNYSSQTITTLKCIIFINRTEYKTCKISVVFY